MTSAAIRVPPPSRPTKKQGHTTHLTPRHSRRPEPIETANFQHETEMESNSNCNRTGSSMDAPLSPPRSMIGLLRSADTSDPSVLSPREASDLPSSPVSSYQVPASFRLHHRHTSGSKRSRSVSEKENAHNITTTVAQLFSGRRNDNITKNDRTSTDSNNSENTVPYDWTVNVEQLSPEKQTKLYWNLCYGVGAGTTHDMDTFGAEISNKYSLQDSWSARRLPPPKGWYVTSISKGFYFSVLYYCISSLTLSHLFINEQLVDRSQKETATHVCYRPRGRCDEEERSHALTRSPAIHSGHVLDPQVLSR
jgi:hypothetical protein